METQKQDVVSLLYSFKVDPFTEQKERLIAESEGKGKLNFFFSFVSSTLINDLIQKYGEREIETSLAIPGQLHMYRLALESGKTKYDYAFLIPITVRRIPVFGEKIYIMKDVEIVRFFEDLDAVGATFPGEQEKIKEKYPELTEYINSPHMTEYFEELIDGVNAGENLENPSDRGKAPSHTWNLSFLLKDMNGETYRLGFTTNKMFRYYGISPMIVKGKLALW